MLDRTLPGPLLDSPTPLLALSLAEETLDHNEMQIFAATDGSRIPQADERLSETATPPGPAAVSALAGAFADTLRTPYSDILQVGYQASVITANHTDDRQHLSVRFGRDIPAAGPLIGSRGSRSLLSRLDEAERSVLARTSSTAQPTRRSLSAVIGSETRSIRAVGDTVATLTVLNIDDTFPTTREGRTLITDDGLEIARLEAWRRVLEESRASTLDDWQKAAIGCTRPASIRIWKTETSPGCPMPSRPWRTLPGTNAMTRSHSHGVGPSSGPCSNCRRWGMAPAR